MASDDEEEVFEEVGDVDDEEVEDSSLVLRRFRLMGILLLLPISANTAATSSIAMKTSLGGRISS